MDLRLEFFGSSDSIITRIDEMGEIHGIGFDDDNSQSDATFFNVGGTQAWGIGGNSGYGTVEGDWVHYEIPVGDHFTGDFDRLVFVTDHDLSPSDGAALFRDVSVHAAGGVGVRVPPPTGRVQHTHGLSGKYFPVELLYVRV